MDDWSKCSDAHIAELYALYPNEAALKAEYERRQHLKEDKEFQLGRNADVAAWKHEIGNRLYNLMLNQDVFAITRVMLKGGEDEGNVYFEVRRWLDIVLKADPGQKRRVLELQDRINTEIKPLKYTDFDLAKAARYAYNAVSPSDAIGGRDWTPKPLLEHKAAEKKANPAEARPNRDGCKWTQADHDVIAHMAHTHTTAEVAAKIGRTPAAVQQYAMRNKISFRAAKRSR